MRRKKKMRLNSDKFFQHLVDEKGQCPFGATHGDDSCHKRGGKYERCLIEKNGACEGYEDVVEEAKRFLNLKKLKAIRKLK